MSRRAPDRLGGLLIITHSSELIGAKARVLGLAAHASFEVAPPSGGSAPAGLGPASEPSRCSGCGLASAWRGVDSGDYCGFRGLLWSGVLTTLRLLHRPLIGPAQGKSPHPSARKGAAEANPGTCFPGRGLARVGVRRSHWYLGRRENGGGAE